MKNLTGNFSRLVVFFRFERQIGHHLIQTFAPSTLVVMLSWFSFWLDLDAIPGRVALLVTSMLTLVTMFTGLKSDIPPVAYIKVSMWICFIISIIFSNSLYPCFLIKIYVYAGTGRLDGWLHDVRVRSSGWVRRSQGARCTTRQKWVTKFHGISLVFGSCLNIAS